MNALIVYDSVFGNTEKIARAVAEALGGQAVSASQVTPDRLRGLDLLIVGSPTRGWRPTEAITKMFDSLPAGSLEGVRAAAFDTRLYTGPGTSFIVRMVVTKGAYAAPKIGKLLEEKGGKLAAPPEGFLVDGDKGPVRAGEMERAAEWARTVAAGITAPA